MNHLFAAMTLASALIALPALAQDARPQRYAVELQLMEAGKEVVLASTFVAVGGTANLTLTGDQDALDFNTTVHAQQGDGAEDLLVTEVNLFRNGRKKKSIKR